MNKRGHTGGKRGALAQEFKSALAAYQANDLAKARKLLRPVLKAMPDNLDVVHLMGVVATGLGDFEPAERLLRDAVKLAPNNAAVWNNLGEALRHQGRHEDALTAYRTAAQVQPDFVGAYNNQAVALLALERSDEALTAAELALSKAPTMVMAMLNRGQALEDLDRGGEADAVYRDALKLQPNNPQTLARLASRAAEQKDYPRAAKLFRDALSKAPNDRETLLNYGALLQELLRLEAAATLYQDMLRTFRGDSVVLHRLGKTLQSMDDVPGALRYLDEALQTSSADDAVARAEILTTKGTTLLADGRTDEAKAAYVAALEHHPGAVQTLRLLSSNHKAASADDALLQRTEALIEGGDHSESQAKHLYYAAGKWREDLGDLDVAASHIFAANRCNDLEHDYTVAQFAQRIDRLIAAFSPSFAQSLPLLDAEPDGNATPIFIVGMPRSGSTLTEQILASHSAVHAFGEQNHLTHTISDTERRLGLDFPTGWLEAIATEDFGPDQARTINDDYRRRLQTRASASLPLPPGTRAVTDKLLDNFIHLGAIRMIFPTARIINCTRDPLENALSMFKLLLHGHEYATNVDNLAGHIAQYQRLMEHWHTVFPGWILPVSYEALVADPEPMTRTTLAHCGLPWDDACLEPHKTKRVVRTLSISQVREPIYQSSMKLSDRYGAALDPLRAALTKAGVAFGQG